MFSFDFVKNKQQQQEENTAYLVNMGEGAWGQKGKDVVLARQEFISYFKYLLEFQLKVFTHPPAPCPPPPHPPTPPHPGPKGDQVSFQK